MSKKFRIVIVLAALAGVLTTVGSESSRAASRSVALVVGAEPLGPSDQVLADVITGLGDTPVAVVDDDLPTTSLDDFDVVVITSTVNPSIVPTSLADIRVPTVLMEPTLFDDFGLAQSSTERTGSAVRILEPLHPLAAGLSGAQTVQTSGTTLNAARVSELGAGAEVVAAVAGSSGWATVVGYPFAAPIIDGSAPAGRVALFPVAGAILNPTGISLVETAVEWVANEVPGDRPPVIVGVDTTTLHETGPSDAVLATFEGFDPDGDPFDFGCLCPDFLAVSAAGELRAVGDIDYETTPVVTITVFIGALEDGIALTVTFDVIDDPTDNVDTGNLQASVTALAARIDELEALTDGSIADRLDALEAANADLEDENEALSQRVSTLESELDTAQTTLGNVQTVLAPLQVKVQGNVNDLANLEGDVFALFSRLQQGFRAQGVVPDAPNAGFATLYCPDSRPQPYAPSMRSDENDFRLFSIVEVGPRPDTLGGGYQFFYERRSLLDTSADENVYVSIRCL